MDEEDYELYILAELHYTDEYSGEFPLNWYNSNNYKIKTEIITEALEKHIKIEDTDLYKQACMMNRFD